MMNIFLTGGTGFIGSNILNSFNLKKHKIYAIKRKNSQPRIPLKENPKWIIGNLDGQFDSYLKKCEILIHLAAHSTNVPYDTIENCLYWNLTAPLKLMNSAKNNGISKFLICGTGFEYGLSGNNFEKIPTTAALIPTTSYPASKAASSIIFNQWAIENKVKLIYCRIFQVFGKGEDEKRLWPSLRKAAMLGNDFNLTNGDQIRDFIPVDLVVKQLIDMMDFNNVKNGKPDIKNIGTGNPQSVREFSEYWWKKWNAKGRLHFGSIPYRDNELMSIVPEI